MPHAPSHSVRGISSAPAERSERPLRASARPAGSDSAPAERRVCSRLPACVRGISSAPAGGRQISTSDGDRGSLRACGEKPNHRTSEWGQGIRLRACGEKPNQSARPIRDRGSAPRLRREGSSMPVRRRWRGSARACEREGRAIRSWVYSSGISSPAEKASALVSVVCDSGIDSARLRREVAGLVGMPQVWDRSRACGEKKPGAGPFDSDFGISSAPAERRASVPVGRKRAGMSSAPAERRQRIPKGKPLAEISSAPAERRGCRCSCVCRIRDQLRACRREARFGAAPHAASNQLPGACGEKCRRRACVPARGNGVPAPRLRRED